MMDPEESAKSPLTPQEAYSQLAVDVLVLTSAAATVSSIAALTCFKGKVVRAVCFGVGAGTGLGWSGKRADTYLRTRNEADLPNHTKLEGYVDTFRTFMNRMLQKKE